MYWLMFSPTACILHTFLFQTEKMRWCQLNFLCLTLFVLENNSYFLLIFFFLCSFLQVIFYDQVFVLTICLHLSLYSILMVVSYRSFSCSMYDCEYLTYWTATTDRVWFIFYIKASYHCDIKLNYIAIQRFLIYFKRK